MPNAVPADDGADGDSSETQEVVGDRERGVREETHQRNFGGLHEGVAVAAHGAVHLFQLRRDRSTRGRTSPFAGPSHQLICLYPRARLALAEMAAAHTAAH